MTKQNFRKQKRNKKTKTNCKKSSSRTIFLEESYVKNFKILKVSDICSISEIKITERENLYEFHEIIMKAS